MSRLILKSSEPLRELRELRELRAIALFRVIHEHELLADHLSSKPPKLDHSLAVDPRQFTISHIT